MSALGGKGQSFKTIVTLLKSKLCPIDKQSSFVLFFDDLHFEVYMTFCLRHVHFYFKLISNSLCNQM